MIKQFTLLPAILYLATVLLQSQSYIKSYLVYSNYNTEGLKTFRYGGGIFGFSCGYCLLTDMWELRPALAICTLRN